MNSCLLSLHRREDPYLWKLDRTENFSRKRMRLARSYHSNTHQDASHLRDLASTPLVKQEQIQLAEGSLLLAKVTNSLVKKLFLC